MNGVKCWSAPIFSLCTVFERLHRLERPSGGEFHGGYLSVMIRGTRKYLTGDSGRSSGSRFERFGVISSQFVFPPKAT